MSEAGHQTPKTRSKNPGNNDGISAVLARLEAMETSMNRKIETITDAFEDKLDKLRADLKADLKTELLPDIQRNSENIAANSNRISDLEDRIQQLEHESEMNDKAYDLIMKGIPQLAKENVFIYYKKAATAIGFEVNNIPRADVFRLGRGAASSTIGPPILVKFTNKLDKGDFFKKYLANLNLKLSDLGFESSQTRVYISENLTKADQALFAAALKLRKDKKIFSVKTSFGAVYVKKKEGDKWALIKEPSMLGDSF
jgi:virulence-associated protein VapD